MVVYFAILILFIEVKDMKALRIYETRIEIYPYKLGDYPDLERVCSTKYDSVRHRREPLGFHYDENTKTLIVPRGVNVDWLHQLTGSFPTYYHSETEAMMKYRYKFTAKPRNTSQVMAILFLLSRNTFSRYANYSQLALTVEPGFGKTFCAIAASLERGKRTIIIVHSNQIKEQWLKTLREKTNVKMDRVLELSGSEKMHSLLKKKVDCDIIITIHDSIEAYISKYGYDGMQKLMGHLECGTKIIDEAHLYFTSTLMIDFCSNISKNYYLTATFTRSNRLETDLFALVFANTAKYGEELGITRNVIYNFVYYNSNPDEKEIARIKTAYGTNNYRFIEYAIDHDPNSTFLGALFYALSLAKEHPGKILVIVPKIEYCELIARTIQIEYPEDKVGTVHSKHSKEDNLKIQEECDIIVSTLGSLGTGADIPGLRNMIIGELYSSEVTAKQLPKRLRPLENGEDSYCYELVDTGFESILTMVRKKTRFIKKIAKKIKKINY